MKKYLLILVLAAAIAPGLAEAIPISARIAYPIAELGNCASKLACKSYCDQPKNMSACLDYADDNSLLNPSIISKSRAAAKKILAGKTPGACASRSACNAYCQDDRHFNECFAFAEKSGKLNTYEKNLLKASKGPGPGGCKIGTDQCEKYCALPANYKECEKFAIDGGLVAPDDASAFSGDLPAYGPLTQYPPTLRKKLTACMQGKIGAARFDKLWKGTVKETSADTAALERCLEGAANAR